MAFHLIRCGVTRMKTDAIVNAANDGLLEGSGVCGAVFREAGAQRMTEACRAIGRCPTGEAVLTPGFDLPAPWVIHAVGPVWQGGRHGEEQLLYRAYASSLELAAEKGLHSIAFPLISAGIFGFPPARALQIASKAIGDFLNANEMEVWLCLLHHSSCELPGTLEAGLRSALADAEGGAVDGAAAPELRCCRVCAPGPEDPLALLEPEDFSAALQRAIDERGMTDVEVYKRANLDRRLFSKLRHPGCRPAKATVLALTVALRLNPEEARALLEKAGFALSRACKTDVIVEYFLEQGRFDIFEVNAALFRFSQKTLGAA